MKDPAIGVSDDTDPGTQTDPMDPADKIREWYRAILGGPCSWTDDKWQEIFEQMTGASAKAEDSNATANPFKRYLDSLEENATLPSQMNESRTPVKLQEPQEKEVDVRGIRYLTPAGQLGASEAPCLMIHEKRLSALLSLSLSASSRRQTEDH